MAKAETLLAMEPGISETCHALGFESQPSFCIYFKALGLTPTGFQKKAIPDKLV